MQGALRMPDTKMATLLAEGRVRAAGPPIGATIQSFLPLPGEETFFSFEKDQWTPRHLESAEIAGDLPPARFLSIETMWTDRHPSPDGQWLIALDGQTSLEIRHHDHFEERRILDWKSGIPRGFGFWPPRPGWLFALLENGVTELWDLASSRRLACSPAPVDAAGGGAAWAPAQADGAAWLDLAPNRVVYCRREGGALGELRPAGRRPIVGAGLSPDGRSAIVITAGAPFAPGPDPWVAGEILLFDLASGRLVSACAHGIGAAGGARAQALAPLTHVIFQTREGGLACVESASGRIVWSIGARFDVTAAAFSRDGRRLLLGLADGEVVCLEEDLKTPAWRRRAHEFHVAHVALSASGERAVSVGADRSILCWDVAEGRAFTGVRSRYDRTRDPLALLSGPQAASEIDLRLGPPLDCPLAGDAHFTFEAGGRTYHVAYDNISDPRIIWKGEAEVAPGRDGYIVFEWMPEDEKKKGPPMLGALQLDVETGERRSLTAFEAPQEIERPPLYLKLDRVILPGPKHSLTLERLDRRFRAEVKLDLGGWPPDEAVFHVAPDGSAFAFAHGAEVRVYRSEDGHLMGRIPAPAGMDPADAELIALWVAPGGGEAAVVRRGGALQRWKLNG